MFRGCSMYRWEKGVGLFEWTCVDGSLRVDIQMLKVASPARTLKLRPLSAYVIGGSRVWRQNSHLRRLLTFKPNRNTEEDNTNQRQPSQHTHTHLLLRLTINSNFSQHSQYAQSPQNLPLTISKHGADALQESRRINNVC